jgi:hypothetical protein
MRQIKEKTMNEPCTNDACKNGTCQHDACKSKSSMHDACDNDTCKVVRKLPPHELNARRNRKRAVTHLPGVASLPAARHHHHKPSHSPNDSVFNHASNPLNRQ